jgi:transcriptional regulator with XRE-family HTH domain
MKQISVLTKQEVSAILHEAIKKAGSQKAFAEQCGVSVSYMSDVVNQARRPGHKILDQLHITSEIIYRTASRYFVAVTCDRCERVVYGAEDETGTAGFYRRGGGWQEYMNDSEGVVCDSCMWADGRYKAEYGVSE